MAPSIAEMNEILRIHQAFVAQSLGAIEAIARQNLLHRGLVLQLAEYDTYSSDLGVLVDDGDMILFWRSWEGFRYSLFYFGF